MTAKIALIFLGCTIFMQIHAGNPETQWPLQVRDSRDYTYYNSKGYKRTATTDVLYYIHPHITAPFTQHTLGEVCQVAHQCNLPWCFLVASIKQNHKPMRTIIYDTVTLYSLMAMRNWLPKIPDQYFLPQARKFLAAACNLEDKHVRLRVFNCYPGGRITSITPAQGDRVALQARFTRNLLYGCHDEPVLRTLAEHYNSRYITKLQSSHNQLCTTNAMANIRADAQFWLERYLHVVPGNMMAQAALAQLLTESCTTLYQ